MSRYLQQTRACSALQIRLRPGVTCVCPAQSEFEMPFTKQNFLCKGNFEKKIFWKIRNDNSMSSSRFYHCVSAIRFREFNQSKIWSTVIWQYLAFSLPESDLELALHFYLVFCDKLASFPRFWMTLEKHSEITKCSNIKLQTKQMIYYNGWEHIENYWYSKISECLAYDQHSTSPSLIAILGKFEWTAGRSSTQYHLSQNRCSDLHQDRAQAAPFILLCTRIEHMHLPLIHMHLP
jgi:hypothetical protein